MGPVRVGTSGYQYRHWRGVLYPAGLAQRRWLAWYARYFDTVELNATFYRLPRPEAVDRWRDEVPEGFRFAVKGSRYLTHMKQLRDPEAGLARFLAPVERLGDKLGPILWQLPARLAPDPGRLDAFLSALPSRLPRAVEFRSDRWYTREVCAVLDRHGAAFCEHDLVEARPPRLTGSFRYLRFHGATGRYQGRYGEEALRRVARDLSRHARGREEAWVFFNNDVHGHAVRDAAALRRLLGAHAGGRARSAVETAGSRSGMHEG
ncbi:MAG TPA: DUF72 domain-containing protein [Anaeromyxobacteraceae bacterium]|jgi:uncharacterized protein YecE (DUF72 family)|nr:DUF72 domain-containing protein [Anaeromyxobacteraceae bacterium]